MRILGIDSSTTATGYAILDENKILLSGVIRPNKALNSIERIICIEKEINVLYDK